VRKRKDPAAMAAACVPIRARLNPMRGEHCRGTLCLGL
jgi:hypothetical protein